MPSTYEFTTAVRRQTTQPDTRYRRRDLPDEDVTWVNGLPVTTVARTIKDLATGGTDFDHLAVAVRDAVTSTNAASVALIQALEPAAERFGFPDGKTLFLALLNAAGYQPPRSRPLSNEQGRIFHEAWIAGVTKHLPGEPKPGYIAPWEDTPDWERESASAVYDQVRAFVEVSEGSTSKTQP